MEGSLLQDVGELRRFLRAFPVEEVNAKVLSDLLRLLRRGDGNSRPIPSINPAVTSVARFGAPVDAIGGFLDAILLAHATAEDADTGEVESEVFFERFKPRSANQVLCGYLFQRNDIVFNCKTCQADETCVLCLKCFQNGNHEGHDVFFHRTTPGGVCDCGDSEAWAPEGFCIHHGQRNNSSGVADSSTGTTGSIPLPQELLRVADVLFEVIVAFFAEMAKRSIQVFDAERVDGKGRQMLHAAHAQLQQQHHGQGNFGASFTFGNSDNTQPSIDERQFHVRVCNDDVHSDEDLIRSLNQKQIPHAEDLVRAIDSNGSELVSVNLALRHALMLMQELKAEGWHVCVVDDAHIHDEDVMLAVARWIKRICSLSKPLHDLFCDKLFAVPDPPPDALVQAREPIHTMFLSDAYFRKDIALELYELYLKLQGDKDPKLKFSIVFMKVYNRMMLKYFCGIGTREESLFQYGVQILTTPSIVNHLAGMGLLETLLDTINTALDLAKQSTSQLPPGITAGIPAGRGVGSITGSIPGFGGRQGAHLHVVGNGRASISSSNLWQTLDCEHPILKFRRYHYVVENLSYVLGITSMCSELLLRKDLLSKWFDALNLIQGLDPQVRIQEGCAHVTYETQTWLTAFSFHSSVSKIIALLARGLRYHEGADPDRDKEVMFHNVLTCFWEQLDRFGIPEHRFQQFTPPFGWVTGLPRRETIVKFDVGTQPVSFHNTLHNLVSSFLMETIYYGPSSQSAGVDGALTAPWISNWGELIRTSLQRAFGDEWIQNYDKQELMMYGMMEYPLRTLVLCAQIHCGLWIRNGQNMQRQLINYVSPPWCSEQRDLDLFLVQISAPIVGFSKFLTIFFDRFGLAEWIITWLDSRNDSGSGDESRAMSRSSHGGHRSSSASSVSVAAPDDKLIALLEMALMNLIWIVSELMPPLKAIEAQDTVLRREVVHRLSQQPCRLSEILDQTTFVVQTPFGGVAKKQHLARVERILAEVADEQSKRGVGGGASDEFDDHEGDSGEPVLYVLKKEFFREYDPAFYHLSRSGHEKAQFARQEALFKTWKVQDPPIPLVSALPPAHESMQVLRLLVLERSLLGLLRVILEDATTTVSASAAASAGGKRTNVMVVLRALHLVNLIVLVLQTSTSRAAVIIPESKRRQTLALLRCGPEAFEEEEDTSRGKKRARRQFGDSEADIQMSSDSDQGGVESSNTEVEDLSIVAMLVLLSTDQVQNDLETSKSTISTIYWILRELSAMDPIVHAYVDDRVWSGMKKKEANLTEKGLSKAQLKKLHQQRAIEAMMARQKAFAQSQMFADMEDDDELDEYGDGGGSHGDDHGGTATGADTSSPDTIVYRPPPPPDCIICSQKKKDEPIMYIGHAQMTQVTTHAYEDRPNEETVGGARNPGEPGDRGERSPVASPGVASPGSAESSPATSTPLSSLPFPPPIFISLCGHAVHLHCWKKYFESVKAQSRYNLEHSQSNIAFDAHYGEFLCPLCQSLSSMLVPYVPISEPLTLSDRERAREAMEGVFQAKQDTSSILSWLCDGLPSRLDALSTEDTNATQAAPATGSGAHSDSEDGLDASEDDDAFDDDGEDTRMSGDESPSTRFALRAQQRREQNDESRAMKQFALSFLETMLRFQPEMATHVTAAMAALKKSFFACGPQLAHLIWSSVATTLASVQLNGMSSAIFSLEMFGRARRSRRHHRGEFGSFSSASESTGSAPGSAASSFSTLRITSILNPAKAKAAGPCLKTRLAVSLPESVESQLDTSTPKDDSKLNVLLRSLKHLHLLVSSQGKQRYAFYRAVVAPLAMSLRLELPADEWKESLNLGAPASLGQPILGQDLVYACVAICSSMLSTKADILLTIRSFCVLHMAQVLSQLARMPAEDEDDDDVSDADGSASDRPGNDVSSSSDSDVDSRRSLSMSPPPPPTTAQLHQQQLQREHTVLMQRCLETLMDRISDAAGIGLDTSDRPPAPRGSQLLLLFQSSCLSFMRQVTLLCRAFFRGENDPDASWSANFVSSLRLSTNYLAMCQQLGVPTVDQVAADADLMSYLLQAAQELQTRPFASVPVDVQRNYRQHGHVESMLSAVDEAVRASEDDDISTRRRMMQSNFEAMPALPLRFAEETPRAGSTVDRDDDADAACGKKKYRFANVRLVRLAASYTDLHAEVLGKSKCKQTWKMVENPAICLVCAQVLCAGTECCRRRRDGMGACTHHAMTCGSGVGLFFLMRSSSVLLIFGPRSSYFGSPYLDMFGEEDINVRRGRPLFLSAKRMKALQTLYATHQLANEVARNRRTSDQYIRTNYY